VVKLNNNGAMYQSLGNFQSANSEKEAIKGAYNAIAVVGQPAFYTWFYSGVWFGCGYLYSDKNHGELLGFKYIGNIYIAQCMSENITVSIVTPITI
jgi:hypothetical protein